MADLGRFVGEPPRPVSAAAPGNPGMPAERRDAARAGTFEFFLIDTDRPHLRELAVESGDRAGGCVR